MTLMLLPRIQGFTQYEFAGTQYESEWKLSSDESNAKKDRVTAMETTILVEREFADIKEKLDSHCAALKVLLLEEPVERMTKEWRKMARRRIALLRHEVDAMDEWMGRRNIDGSRQALAMGLPQVPTASGAPRYERKA